MNFKNFGISRPPPPAAAADGDENILLSRQPSIYSLTLDEFQSIMGGIGKDFGSLSMDEPLKNIWSAEVLRKLKTKKKTIKNESYRVYLKMKEA
ncbi:hypothetical protein V6N13_054009 [Hibiscus sabdariffa]